ncbi:MAG: LysR substrate-binding domain-containing protein [Burkholderiaceae bacterium]
MARLKLEQLRVFATVAELGNIRDASAKLGRTQSAVSMTLKQLETEIGDALFERDRKSALTALGRFTLETARRQLASFDLAEQNIRSYAANAIGRVTVACVPSVASRAMPAILQRFIAENPRIELDMRDADSLTIETLVEHEEVDFGISLPPRRGSPLRFQRLYRDRFFLFCRSDNPLTRLDRPVRWADLVDETLIRNVGLDLVENASYRALAENSRLFVRNATSLLALVQAGVGVTVLPVLDVARRSPEIAVLPLADPNARQQIGLLTRARTEQAPAARAFIDLVLRELGEPEP